MCVHSNAPNITGIQPQGDDINYLILVKGKMNMQKHALDKNQIAEGKWRRAENE